MKKVVVVAPDVGGVKTARAFAKRLNGSLAIVDKRRLAPDQVETIHLIGDVCGCDTIIVDDLISTGNTIMEATQILLKNKASSVYVSCTHPVFSAEAVTKLNKAPINEIIITDTIPTTNLPSKFTTLTVSNFLAEAIKRIHLETSVSTLFI